MCTNLCGRPVWRGHTWGEEEKELIFQLVVFGDSGCCNFCHTGSNICAGNKILKSVSSTLTTIFLFFQNSIIKGRGFKQLFFFFFLDMIEILIQIHTHTYIWRPQKLNLHSHRWVELFGKGDHWTEYPSDKRFKHWISSSETLKSIN